MATYRVMTWRDIPAQVQATDEDGATVNLPMPPLYQQEIDRVAMREGITESDAYLDAWDWSSPSEREGGAQEVAEAVVSELDAEWRRAAGR